MGGREVSRHERAPTALERHQGSEGLLHVLGAQERLKGKGQQRVQLGKRGIGLGGCSSGSERSP
jgi:hypothetical protein